MDETPHPTAKAWKDDLPIEIKLLVRAAREQRGLSWEELAIRSGADRAEFAMTAPVAKRGYTRATLQRLAVTLDDSALRRYTERDLCWDEVARIEEVGEQPVYRVAVATGLALVAGDIFCLGDNGAASADVAVLTPATSKS